MISKFTKGVHPSVEATACPTCFLPHVSRRQFLKTAAGAAGVVLGSSLWKPALADGGGADPKPIPTGIRGPNGLLHIYLPGSGAETSTITDFAGFVGVANVKGQGTTNDGTRLYFDVDSRFMKGIYLGTDGRPHRGAFALV